MIASLSSHLRWDFPFIAHNCTSFFLNHFETPPALVDILLFLFFLSLAASASISFFSGKRSLLLYMGSTQSCWLRNWLNALVSRYQYIILIKKVRCCLRMGHAFIICKTWIHSVSIPRGVMIHLFPLMTTHDINGFLCTFKIKLKLSILLREF
jgi:hypothetical protein